MVEVRETRWWVSPFLRGGWWISGDGRERALGTGGDVFEECECDCESEAEAEDDDDDDREGLDDGSSAEK